MTLPKRAAGQSSCPAPSRPVASLNDPALLRAVLDGLRRLNSKGLAR